MCREETISFFPSFHVAFRELQCSCLSHTGGCNSKYRGPACAGIDKVHFLAIFKIFQSIMGRFDYCMPWI
ncbi:hypothetical protein Mapa_000891 [Marchantia paleacea]|nr:hypothetical protein Mapa_000891 [Marchantia paleacea]